MIRITTDERVTQLEQDLASARERIENLKFSVQTWQAQYYDTKKEHKSAIAERDAAREKIKGARVQVREVKSLLSGGFSGDAIFDKLELALKELEGEK